MAESKHPLVLRTDAFLEKYGKATTVASLLGMAMTLGTAAYLFLKGILQSADPIGATFLIVSLTLLFLGLLGEATKTIVAAVAKRKREQEWPVTISSHISRHRGIIDLNISNRSASQKMKVVLLSGLGIRGLETPLSLPWTQDDEEYRLVPRKMYDTVRLCYFSAQWGEQADDKPEITLTFPSVRGERTEFTTDLSTFWTGKDDEAVASVMLSVAVAGIEEGYLGDFHVIVEARAGVGRTVRYMNVQVDIPDHPHGMNKSYATLMRKELQAESES